MVTLHAKAGAEAELAARVLETSLGNSAAAGSLVLPATHVTRCAAPTTGTGRTSWTSSRGRTAEIPDITRPAEILKIWKDIERAPWKTAQTASRD